LKTGLHNKYAPGSGILPAATELHNVGGGSAFVSIVGCSATALGRRTINSFVRLNAEMSAASVIVLRWVYARAQRNGSARALNTDDDRSV